ncbi:NAD-dependent epimerase/dehydratase family protein [Ktedonosporobacter rubrisoli]|uniref:NAD-dependent epimerase/dehydratase family protein n=1 Tax=Ktedonosporobacter rubrisoli TaxID=2509675 RepID=A0A4P6JU51_KTERU|nr:NAD-dependent epimerase/dehydratase family protein [Ktedonosporobacter rubrisoli]QBD79148.1 NAD-dependent epimerase/dehydratase family protein [Ktedonosporobacter rubrisoli]
MPNASPFHVVLGATGGVGQALVQELATQGAHLRAVNRSGQASVPPGVEVMAADLTDSESTRAACQGASIVYHCAGAPYPQWAASMPIWLDNIISAVSGTEATLVYIDNNYMYAPTAQPLTEDSNQAPSSRKGQLRKQLAEAILTAHTQGKIKATIGRTPDFYGPGVRASAMGEQFFSAVVAGSRVPWLGKLDVPHAFSFVEDVARGLITLGTHEEALGQVWHLPTAPALTGRQYIALASEAAGVQARPLPVSGLLLRILGLTNLVLRESVEMLYAFNAPLLFDGSKYSRTFGETFTSHQEAMRRTVTWYRELATPRSVENAEERTKA